MEEIILRIPVKEAQILSERLERATSQRDGGTELTLLALDLLPVHEQLERALRERRFRILADEPVRQVQKPAA